MNESETIIYPKAKRKIAPSPETAPASSLVEESPAPTPKLGEGAGIAVEARTGKSEGKASTWMNVAEEADACGEALDAIALLSSRYANPADLGSLTCMGMCAIGKLRESIADLPEPSNLAEAHAIGGISWLSRKLAVDRNEIADEIFNLASVLSTAEAPPTASWQPGADRVRRWRNS